MSWIDELQKEIGDFRLTGGNMKYGFVYIIAESKNGKLDEYNDCAKIGVNHSQNMPWQRLRMLQQGNTRALSMRYLYIGSYTDTMNLELDIKRYLCNGSEWVNKHPDEVRSYVDRFIERRQYNLVLAAQNYRHTSYGTCSWTKSKTTVKELYELAGGVGKNVLDNQGSQFDNLFE